MSRSFGGGNENKYLPPNKHTTNAGALQNEGTALGWRGNEVGDSANWVFSRSDMGYNRARNRGWYDSCFTKGKRMKTVTRRWFVGLCLSGLSVAACLSPTLPPLPPPSEPQMSYDAPGQLRLQGVVAAERTISVIAVNNRSGAIGGRVVRDGRYSFPLEAEPGDEIELWYEKGADVSESLFLEAPEYPSVDVVDAGADAGAEAGDAGP